MNGRHWILRTATRVAAWGLAAGGAAVMAVGPWPWASPAGAALQGISIFLLLKACRHWLRAGVEVGLLNALAFVVASTIKPIYSYHFIIYPHAPLALSYVISGVLRQGRQKQF